METDCTSPVEQHSPRTLLSRSIKKVHPTYEWMTHGRPHTDDPKPLSSVLNPRQKRCIQNLHLVVSTIFSPKVQCLSSYSGLVLPASSEARYGFQSVFCPIYNGSPVLQTTESMLSRCIPSRGALRVKSSNAKHTEAMSGRAGKINPGRCCMYDFAATDRFPSWRSRWEDG